MAIDEVEDMRAAALRLMVSITDRGDDMLFPINFIIPMLPRTHCTTSDSTLLSLLLSDNVYLHVEKHSQQ